MYKIIKLFYSEMLLWLFRVFPETVNEDLSSSSWRQPTVPDLSWFGHWYGFSDLEQADPVDDGVPGNTRYSSGA